MDIADVDHDEDVAELALLNIFDIELAAGSVAVPGLSRPFSLARFSPDGGRADVADVAVAALHDRRAEEKTLFIGAPRPSLGATS